MAVPLRVQAGATSHAPRALRGGGRRGWTCSHPGRSLPGDRGSGLWCRGPSAPSPTSRLSMEPVKHRRACRGWGGVGRGHPEESPPDGVWGAFVQSPSEPPACLGRAEPLASLLSVAAPRQEPEYVSRSLIQPQNRFHPPCAPSRRLPGYSGLGRRSPGPPSPSLLLRSLGGPRRRRKHSLSPPFPPEAAAGAGRPQILGAGVQAGGPLAQREPRPVQTLRCAFACAAEAP